MTDTDTDTTEEVAPGLPTFSSNKSKYATTFSTARDGEKRDPDGSVARRFQTAESALHMTGAIGKPWSPNPVEGRTIEAKDSRWVVTGTVVASVGTFKTKTSPGVYTPTDVPIGEEIGVFLGDNATERMAIEAIGRNPSLAQAILKPFDLVVVWGKGLQTQFGANAWTPVSIYINGIHAVPETYNDRTLADLAAEDFHYPNAPLPEGWTPTGPGGQAPAAPTPAAPAPAAPAAAPAPDAAPAAAPAAAGTVPVTPEGIRVWASEDASRSPLVVQAITAAAQPGAKLGDLTEDQLKQVHAELFPGNAGDNFDEEPF